MILEDCLNEASGDSNGSSAMTGLTARLASQPSLAACNLPLPAERGHGAKMWDGAKDQDETRSPSSSPQPQPQSSVSSLSAAIATDMMGIANSSSQQQDAAFLELAEDVVFGCAPSPTNISCDGDSHHDNDDQARLSSSSNNAPSSSLSKDASACIARMQVKRVQFAPEKDNLASPPPKKKSGKKRKSKLWWTKKDQFQNLLDIQTIINEHKSIPVYQVQPFQFLFRNDISAEAKNKVIEQLSKLPTELRGLEVMMDPSIGAYRQQFVRLVVSAEKELPTELDASQRTEMLAEYASDMSLSSRLWARLLGHQDSL